MSRALKKALGGITAALLTSYLRQYQRLHCLNDMEADRQVPADISWIIGLNEECCFRGRGKVYVLGPDCDQPSSDERMFCKTAFEAFKKVPRFFYLPAAMSNEERDHWTSLGNDHKLKLAYRRPRQTGLPNYIPVLPFDLSIGHKEPQIESSKAAPVTICVRSCLIKALVGLTSELEAACNLDTGLVLTNLAGWSRFEPWSRQGLHAVVHELDKLYTEHPEHLEFYSSLVDGLVTAANTAAGVGQAYGFVPGEAREVKKERAQASRQWRQERGEQRKKENQHKSSG
ncbi:hypothetical protein EDD37DRAFT_371804 [Exophiala viscosa]|uniref:uncharacterized protein n=1 Tax=Exophiala viscosa TaxID=2486360 RepID=UPI0021A13394|nr:hypothetical protein EDD37DRAFT_371804 [Exophiala viscosa]